LPKLFEMNQLPNSTCQNYEHNEGFKYCAQRSTLEIIYHLGPFLQPHLKPNSFRLVDNFLESTLTGPEEKFTTYALDDHLYEQLVTLMQNVSTCGKLSMAWRNEVVGEPKGTLTIMLKPEECEGGTSTEEAATTTNN